MSRTRSMVGTALASAILAFGCGLDVTGSGGLDDGEGGGGGSADAAGADGARRGDGGGAGSDGALDADAPGFDAAPPCDLDRDGHTSKACGGDDCCDNDARVHPGAPDYQPAPTACGGFDYDCNGKEERETPVASCQSGVLCRGSGFDQDTPCGAQSAHTSCLGALYVCYQTHETQTQQCR